MAGIVIDYVAERYGRNAVVRLSPGSMAAKAVVRDVTVFREAYGLGDRLAKLIPFEVGMTLDRAFEAEPQLKELIEHDDEVREVWDMAIKLEGLSRNRGKHAGGVVIAYSGSQTSPRYCRLKMARFGDATR